MNKNIKQSANNIQRIDVHNITQINQILDQVYGWSRARNYIGYNKHDGLNSPFLNFFLGFSKWPRIIAIQSVMRCPFNIRPILAVKRAVNPKGLALFTQGLLYRYITTKQQKYLNEAEQLLQKLQQIKSPGIWSGDCWGYHYPWQDLGFYAPASTPNAVVSSFVCEAFLDAYEITHNKKYLQTVKRAINFFLNDLIRLKNTEDELCLSYMPVKMNMRVLDVSILIAAVIARFSQYVQNDAYLIYASRLATYVVKQQTAFGAWYYTDPPSASPISHDNYHTGFILDALYRYMQATDHWQWQTEYELGLGFYANNLFNSDGSPRWMSDQDYPHDIHGAAQGIITFSRHLNQYQSLAQNIVNWTIHNMYHPSGRFYYQARRHWKKKFTLMRWCNAWMARALSEWALRHSDNS